MQQNDEPTKQFGVRMPESLHAAFKEKVARERTSMNDVAVDLITRYVRGELDDRQNDAENQER